MTSLSATAAALQLGVYRTQGRPQDTAGTGKNAAGKVDDENFAVPGRPLAGVGDATSAPRTVVSSTESVRIELSNAARAALLQLQTLNASPGSATPATQRQPGQDPAADETKAETAPLRQWSNAPYIAPGSRLNVTI